MSDALTELRTENAKLRAELARLITAEPWAVAEARARQSRNEATLWRVRYELLAAAAKKWAPHDETVAAALWEGAGE